jgi:predicted ester cyclase
MSESSRSVVERWLRAVASGDAATASDTMASDITLHGMGPVIRGRSSVDFVLRSLGSVFRDLRFDTEILASEGTRVIVRLTASGTQQTALAGLSAGQAREIAGVGAFTLGEHGISDVRVYVDGHQLVTQLESGRTAAAAASSASAEGLESWVDRLTGAAREVWLAGLGALAGAGGQGERVRSIASSGQEYIRDVAATVRDRLDVPTRAEFDELKKRIEQLEARLEPAGSVPATGMTAQSREGLTA